MEIMAYRASAKEVLLYDDEKHSSLWVAESGNYAFV